MKLPIPFLEKKEKAQYFLALILGNEKATSIIFEKIRNSIKFVSTAEEDFKNTIEDAELEEFLNVLDKAITKAESFLPENIETHKTLFGLKESWIEDNKIKKEYLDRLKKASDDLSLDPIGFLVSTESIVNLLQKEEGAPVTAVIVDVGRKFITVSVVKSGKILETKSSEIHESAAYTVDTLLKHFQSPEVLPTRVVIVNSDDPKLKQEFISHKWSKSLPFLHLPQILSMQKNSSVKAMLLGASTQMGTELLYASRENVEDDIPTRISESDVDNANIVTAPVEKENIDTENVEKQKVDFIDEDSSLEYFGFVKDVDIAHTKPQKPEMNQAQVPIRVIENVIEEIPGEEKFAEEQKNPTSINAALVTTKIKTFVTVVLGMVSKIKFEKIISGVKGINNKKILIIPIGILILIIGAFFFFVSRTNAKVNITVVPKIEEKTAAVTFSNSTDIPNAIIAYDSLTVSEDGSITAKATGKKDTGTKSKGKVTVFNNSNNTATFPSGTKITSPNNLVYTLDSGVTVASASGDIFSGTTPGTASVNVTAADIGQDYNLPSGTKFAIGNDADIAAKNDDAFSGGTKKTITIVSKDDQVKLLDALPKQLEDKAKNDIKGKVGSGKTALPTFINKTVSSKVFDKKIDDEASQFTLKGTVDFETVEYDNKEIVDLTSSIFNISKDQLKSDNLDISAKNIGVADNKDVNADLNIKAGILPKIDKSDLSKQIAGISVDKAKNMISNIDQVQGVVITLSPNIPLLPKNLPDNPDKITITITSN